MEKNKRSVLYLSDNDNYNKYKLNLSDSFTLDLNRQIKRVKLSFTRYLASIKLFNNLFLTYILVFNC